MEIEKGAIKSFRDLDVYNRSYNASLLVCKEIVPFLPELERYDLSDQLRRSSKAVPRLIAEGYGKRHQKMGFQKYLDDAIAESNETQVGLNHVRDLYPDNVEIEICDKLIGEYDIISRQLYRLRERWQNFKSPFNTTSISKLASKPISKPRLPNKGISLIEVILVVLIVATVAASTYPMGAGFLTRNRFKNKINEIESSLRLAQLNSISGKENSSWGVNVSATDITLFKGTTYAARDTVYDEVFSIPSSISITPIEVFFDKLTGNPDSIETIVISSNTGDSVTVTLNEVGTVDIN